MINEAAMRYAMAKYASNFRVMYDPGLSNRIAKTAGVVDPAQVAEVINNISVGVAKAMIKKKIKDAGDGSDGNIGTNGVFVMTQDEINNLINEAIKSQKEQSVAPAATATPPVVTSSLVPPSEVQTLNATTPVIEKTTPKQVKHPIKPI